MQNMDGQHVVILGAGYGGLRVAQHLIQLGAPAKGNKVELVDKHTYHTITTQLHKVATGTMPAIELTVSLEYLFRGKPITLTQAEVTGFDFSRKQVKTNGDTPISYDLLVIALGSEANYFGIPGLKENSMSLGSLWQATEIHKHIEEQFNAAQVEEDPARRNMLLTFVIGGGGWTGTELAGDLADEFETLCRQYGISRSDVRLIVVEMAPTILPGLNPEWIEEAQRVLKSKGVELMTNSAVDRVVNDGDGGTVIHIKGSTNTIRTGTLIWTGGVRASDIVANSGLPTGPSGRVRINEYEQAEGYPDIYVIGDSSLVPDPQTGKPMPSSGQLADLQAANVAQNIMARLTHGEQVPFVPHLKGVLISLGGNDAVGDVAGHTISGLPAAIAKRASEVEWLYEIGGPALVLSRTLGPKPKVKK